MSAGGRLSRQKTREEILYLLLISLGLLSVVDELVSVVVLVVVHHLAAALAVVAPSSIPGLCLIFNF